MANFSMPPTGFGPGSQPLAEDDELQYTVMPQDMRTYAPHTPEFDDAARVAAGTALMHRVAADCSASAKDLQSRDHDLTGLDADNRAFLKDVLGEGEVSVRLRGIPAIRAQESFFAGVWLLNGAGVDRLEIAPIPALALERAHQPHRPALLTAAPKPGDIANAPALLAELIDKSRSYQVGQMPHVINLTLLPHTEGDLTWLDAAVGEGSVTILSRGYGNCRVTATALAHVWRVQFYNSMDTLILDTFEVTQMPEVALAADEDLNDSAARILDVLETIK